MIMKGRYHVVWEVEVWADSHEEAAQAAWHYMQQPDSIAGLFTVSDEERTLRIDLHLQHIAQDQ
jgi:hypothetical protein